jgi:hypothetical protein
LMKKRHLKERERLPRTKGVKLDEAPPKIPE